MTMKLYYVTTGMGACLCKAESDVEAHDKVLGNQYGVEYSEWLKLHCEEKWGVWKYAR